MDAYTNPSFCPQPASSATGRVGSRPWAPAWQEHPESPGRREITQVKTTQTHTRVCTTSRGPPAYTFRKKKRLWKVPQFLNFLYFLYSRPESHNSQSCVNKILGSLFQYYAYFLQINIARLLSNVKECVPNESCKQRRILHCWIF